MKRAVVIGLGNFGTELATVLAARGHEVIAVDRESHAVDRIAERVERAVLADGTDAHVLREVGAGRADVGVVSTGRDLASSVLAVLALQDAGVREIHVKVVSDEHDRIVDKLGVAATVFPERESGRRLAERLSSAAVLNWVPLGEGFSLQEMAVPDPWIGKSLRELDLRNRCRISVVARHDMLTNEVTGVPDPDAPLRDSDTLFVAGAAADLKELSKLR